MRLTVVLMAVLCLAGCELPVSTHEPAFTEADAQGAPALRSGIWASASRNCDYDPNKPVSAWPDCVEAEIVRGSEIADLGQPFEHYVLASGYPRVLQTRVMLTPEEGEPSALYLYDAVVAAGFDREGRIVRARRWTVGCPATEKDAPPVYPCLPAEPRTLRDAAKTERGVRSWIWLRDGES